MNVKKFYLYYLFLDLMPIYPIYLLMFEQNGLSVGQISMLLAIWSIPGVLLEIPTGILGDRFSRKMLIVLGGILKGLCYFTWIFSGSFLMYAIGFVFWGVGGALCSGAEEALLYDSLKVQNKEDRFDLILGRGRFLSGISNITASLSGGFIGMQFGIQTALIISVVTSLVSALIALSMKEVNLYKVNLLEQDATEEEDTLKSALSFLIKRRDILLFTLIALLVITTAGVLDEYDQLIAKDYGLSMKLIGIWVSLRFILMAVGGYLARYLRIGMEKLLHIKDRMYSIGFLCLIAAFFLIIAGVGKEMIMMSFYGLFYLLLSAGEVIHEDYIQQKVELEGRSTVHSIISLSQSLYAMLCFGMFALVVTNSSLHTGLVCSGVYIGVITTIILIAYRVRQSATR